MSRRPTGAFTELDTRAFPILYADDEKENLFVFEEAIEDLFPVHLVSNASEALEFMKHNEVSILVTDQRMPEMTGIEPCEIARRRFPGVQRVLVTAYGSQQTAVEAINRAGVSYFLSKPWSIDLMRVTLRNVAETIHLERRVHALRDLLLERERMETLAMSRQALLHDLANAASAVSGCSHCVREVLDETGALLPMDAMNTLAGEMDYLDEAVKYLVALHTRTRRLSLHNASQRDRVLLPALMEVVMGMFRGQFASTVTFEHHCPEGLEIWADSTDVSRVLMNLVRNAAQAIEDTEVAGTVGVEARVEGQKVVICVRDTGPGLPAKIRECLFEPFHTTRATTGGTGLGLSICQKLTNSNMGTITLLPTARGTTFEVRLPRPMAT